MKTLYLFLAAISGFVVCGALRADKAPAKPASRIDVVYVNPEKFTDIKPYYLSSTPDPEPGRYLRIIKEHLESIGPRFIPADQHLTLRITDVDLAGDFEPWRPGSSNTRIIKEIYPPRISLEFTLTDSNGKILKQGWRDLQDNAFLSSATGYPPNEPLRYEKRMLDDWLQDEFGLAKK